MNISDFKPGTKFNANVENELTSSNSHNKFEVIAINNKTNTMLTKVTPPIGNDSEVVLQIKQKVANRNTSKQVIETHLHTFLNNVEFVNA